MKLFFLLKVIEMIYFIYTAAKILFENASLEKQFSGMSMYNISLFLKIFPSTRKCVCAEDMLLSQVIGGGQ